MAKKYSLYIEFYKEGKVLQVVEVPDKCLYNSKEEAMDAFHNFYMEHGIFRDMCSYPDYDSIEPKVVAREGSFAENPHTTNDTSLML